MKREKEQIPLLSSKEDTVTYQINENEHSNVEKEEKLSEINNSYFREEIINCAVINGLSSFFLLSPIDIGGFNFIFQY